MTHLREQFYAVPVPDNAFGFEFNNPLQEGDLVYYLDYPSVYNFRWLPVPDGTWEIVCTSKEVTRMQASEIVELLQIADQTGYRDYSFADDLRYPFIDPLPSLASLLTSKGCDTKQSFLILKKVA